MVNSHKSEDLKTNAVEYYLIGDKTQQEVCKIFKCSPRSLVRWAEKYIKDGNIKRYNRRPIAYKVKKEHVEFLIKELKNNRTITMNELVSKLKDKYNIKLSRFHISRIINDNNISLKLTRIKHIPIKRFGKDIDIKQQLKTFFAEIKKYKLEDIICIDETNINGLQKRKHCYNDIGKRCIIETNSQDVFKKYTAIFAISMSGLIGWKLYEKGGIDSDRLYNFIDKHITSKYKKKIIILDNASSHRNEKIKDLINKKNNLLYSVPYQHYTNSIENFFSMLKSKLQKMEGSTYKELKENIKIALNNITKEIYINIIKGTYNREKYYKQKKLSNRIKSPKNYI